VRIREKNDKKMEKIDNIYKPQNWKKRRRIKNTGKEVYMCVHSKERMETNDVLLQDPFDSLCGKPQSARLTSGANILDLRSEALAQ